MKLKLKIEKEYQNEDCENIYYGDFDEENRPEEIEVSTRELRQRTLGEFDYVAPTISDVVMWLYKEHKIWISVDPDNDINNTWFHTISHGTSTTIFGNYSSPTEAYEAGIEDVLINMI